MSKHPLPTGRIHRVIIVKIMKNGINQSQSGV